MASGWLTSRRPPSLDAVLTAAARRPAETMSYPQVRAVGELALQASPEEVRHLLDVVEEVARPASMPLLTDALLLPLLTAGQGAVDTIGGDTQPSRTAAAEPVATAVVRAWPARNLRAVPGRFVERLTDTAPQDAVLLVNAAAGTLRALPRGKVMSLTQRWYRPVSHLVEQATAEQWKELVEGSWEGPEELLRLLIRAGIRKRTDEPAAYLLAIADSSRWPDMVRETVRIGTLLRTEGSRRRWLPPLDAGP